MIVIPMAGLSSRFTAAGYDRPKYMLPLAGKTVFDHAIGSFEAYFDQLPFLFIGRNIAGTDEFIKQSCQALGLRDARTMMLDAPTAGQAETVELGLRLAQVPDDTALTIFNIDTFRPGFAFPAEPWWAASDGYLEVFPGSGANWSYVRASLEGDGNVLETAEKRPISNLCCSGLYHFNHASDFYESLTEERRRPSASELYVAPLYNHLLAKGRHIHYHKIETDEIIFCGVPAEYEALLHGNVMTEWGALNV